MCTTAKSEILAISIAHSRHNTITKVSHGQHEEKPKLNVKFSVAWAR